MKANCLTRALDQWNENRDLFSLWYNSNHVISLENEYEGFDLIGHGRHETMNYLSLKNYGANYLCKAFQLTPEYRKLLQEYINTEK